MNINISLLPNSEAFPTVARTTIGDAEVHWSTDVDGECAVKAGTTDVLITKYPKYSIGYLSAACFRDDKAARKLFDDARGLYFIYDSVNDVVSSVTTDDIEVWVMYRRLTHQGMRRM